MTTRRIAHAIEARRIAVSPGMRPSPLLALLPLAWAIAGCATIPEGRSAIDSVHIERAKTLEQDDVLGSLATTASPKFLGVFRGLFFDYEIFDASILQRDLARVERYYRGHGFLAAYARAARVVHVAPDHVRVHIVVDEGPPTIVRSVRVDGVDGLPANVGDAARNAATGTLPAGARFDEDAYAKAKTAVSRALTDNGYAYATVQAEARADLSAHAVDFVFTATPGPKAVFGPVTIVDAEPTAAGAPPKPAFEEDALRRAIDIHEGDPYSTAAIDTATQALLDLEVLSAAQIVPTPSDPPTPVVPITVKVQPSKLRTIRVGGGFEFDAIKTEIHGLFEWEHHDFLGDLRNLTITFKPGVVLYPMRVDNIVAPTNPLPEERLRLQFRQPAFLEPQTTLLVQPEGNVFPMLVAPDPLASQPVLGYGELKAAVGLERRFGKHVDVRLSQNFQAEIPFPYTSIRLETPTPAIYLSYPQLFAQLDLRDNPIHPHSGFLAQNDLTAAGLGGTAADVRVQPEVRGYVPIAHGVTFAARASVGFLFSFNYGDYIQHHLYPPLAPSAASNNRLYEYVDRDIEIAYFRGFFGGGPSSNRGFPLRGIAPHGVVPFLSPVTLQEQQQASKTGGTSCIPGQPNYSAAQCSIPIGGFTLWEESTEVRFDISGPFGAALFCDMGDVAAGQAQIRLSHLHLSCGAGARYDTPVGAIRLDLAYRIQPLQVLGYPNEQAASDADHTEGVQPTFFGVLPVALSFGIGESF
jgi:outer membrane protein insertion porin family/translocation and assembly module TamA